MDSKLSIWEPSYFGHVATIYTRFFPSNSGGIDFEERKSEGWKCSFERNNIDLVLFTLLIIDTVFSQLTKDRAVFRYIEIFSLSQIWSVIYLGKIVSKIVSREIFIYCTSVVNYFVDEFIVIFLKLLDLYERALIYVYREASTLGLMIFQF